MRNTKKISLPLSLLLLLVAIISCRTYVNVINPVENYVKNSLSTSVVVYSYKSGGAKKIDSFFILPNQTILLLKSLNEGIQNQINPFVYDSIQMKFMDNRVKTDSICRVRFPNGSTGSCQDGRANIFEDSQHNYVVENEINKFTYVIDSLDYKQAK